MSIVMSTMAKQQASPGAFKLDAICEKLKKTSEDGNDDDVDDSLEMNPYNLSDNNNGGHSGLYHHHHSHGHSGIMPNGSGDDDDDDDDDDECMDEGPLMASPPRRSCFPSNSHEELYGDDSNSNSEVANCSIGGDAMSMRSDETSMNDSEAKELTYEPSTPTEGGPSFGGGGRRNKRKNFKPRNIVYQYDACEDALEGDAMPGEYSSSHQHHLDQSRQEDFHDTSDEGGNDIDQPSSSSARLSQQGNCCFSSKNHEQPLDLSGDTGCPSGSKSSHPPQQQQHMDDAGAMDLSVRHSDSEDEGHNGTAMDLSKSKVSSAEAETSCSSSDDALTTSATTVSASDPLTSTSVAIGTSTMPSSSSSPGASAGGAAGTTTNRASPTSVLMSSRSALGLQRDAAMRVGSLSPGACTTMHGMPSTSTDASAMKDYAESTMKELLGLYGFNDMAESITKSVPLDNFYSGKAHSCSDVQFNSSTSPLSRKILETMSPRLFGASPASLGLCPPTSVASSSPSGLQVTSTQRSPSPQHHTQPLSQQQPSHPPQHPSPHQSQQQQQQQQQQQHPQQPPSTPSHPPHHHHHHHHHHHSPAVSHASTPSALHPHHREGIYDSLCNKVVDSMAKLASLPPNSIIGNPRVILPPNMTTTILTLAAMQDTKFAAAAMAAAAGNSQNKPPVLEPMTQPPIVSPQPSVIVSSSSSPLNVPIPKDPISKAGHIDYTRYVKRYANATECGSNYCKDLNYREHFHCMDCNSRVFVKKEEMIRHFKWHKKRDESLQHGFLRFSPMDDCSDKFQNCSHNRKQTHYHCLKEGCDKVYISTSDVQMHANYHRKDSAIIQEGFQRFRATEDCGVSTCTFFGQRTTHFHCRRANCNYTFKNKADMEKHKTYHIKDEQLNRDGFKKFMKHENCPFESCRFSRVCNHIHCIRAGCSYVLHSSGQLYSHKRKHERSENEMAYRKFKLAQSMLKTFSENQSLGMPGQMSEEGNSSESTSSGIQASNAVPVIQNSSSPAATSNTGSLPTLAGTAPSTASTSSYSISNSNNHHHPNYQQYLSYHSLDQQSLSQLASLLTGVNLNTPLGLPLSLLPPGSKPLSDQLLANQLASVTGIPTPEHLAAMDLTNEMLKPKPDDSWKRYLTRYTANDPCKANCDFLYKDHYHCTAENCHMMFRSKDGVREHARTHEQQDQVTEAFYTTVEAGHPVTCASDCPYQNKEKHYHCCWESCREIILPSDKAFRRLDHYKMHDYSRKLNTGKDPLSMTLTTSVDGMFKRKRGRPPKNRVIEVWPQFPMPSSPSDLPQAIFTSFKLPKPSATLGLSAAVPCTTAAHSLLDKHGTPISAVATPYGLVPTAMLTARPGGNPAVTTTMATPLTMSMLNQMAPSPLQQKAFSTYLRLQPHLQKHAGTTSPVSSAQGGSGHSTGPEDDSAEGGDECDQDEREQEDEEPETRSTPRAPHVSLPGPTESLSSLHASLYSNAVGEAPPLFFPQPRNLAAMPGYHSLISHAQALARSEELRSPQQNGGNNTEFEAQQSPHDSVYSNSGKTSPNQDENLDSNPGSPHWLGSSSRKRSISTSPRNEDYGDAKRSRVTSSMASLRILKDEPVPEGYVRYRFNEDCHYTHCGYREHQTHFHCIRRDCGYSFCDKTRFVQHTARHERLDTLMGGDFQQFRANIPCGRADCLYTVTMSATGSAGNKASHFHCLKCDFVCTDTNKVVAHRRQHQKLDSIMAAGFEKFTPTQSCQMEGCSHNQKQTHYHCVKCQYAVLGLSQMSAHKYRHLE